MKKYIRTKDGRIIGITEKGCIKEFDNKLYAFRDSSFSYRFENGYEVVKQADTIEELCDEFVFDGGDDTPLLCTYEELKYWFNHSKEQQYKIRNCYGAIWTNKGLKYVAKMNNKGELELV